MRNLSDTTAAHVCASLTAGAQPHHRRQNYCALRLPWFVLSANILLLESYDHRSYFRFIYIHNHKAYLFLTPESPPRPLAPQALTTYRSHYTDAELGKLRRHCVHCPHQTNFGPLWIFSESNKYYLWLNSNKSLTFPSVICGSVSRFPAPESLNSKIIISANQSRGDNVPYLDSQI